MFRHVAAFEFGYHFRSPVFWVTTLLFGLLTFGAITSDQVQVGSIGNVKKNSPYAIAQTLQVMSLFAVFIMAAFVANVIVRGDETGFAPIVHSTRVSTFDYLFGRFTGAFAAGCLAFAGVPLAMLLGSFMPWIDPETLGPTRLGHYLYAYAVLCVPTLLVMGAFCFALATMTRSMVSTYVGLVGLLMIYFVASAYFTRPEYEWIVGLVEPFGMGAVSYVTKYWTTAERNTQLPAMAGVLLWNRAIWLGAGFSLLGTTWFLFRRARAASKKALARPTADAPQSIDTRTAAALPVPRFDAATSRTQLVALARFDMAAVFRSPAFFVLLGIGFLNAFGGLWFAEDMYGDRFHPVTRIMVQALAGAFTLIPLIVSIYYAGELVWRERERRLHEMVDATPAPDWASSTTASTHSSPRCHLAVASISDSRPYADSAGFETGATRPTSSSTARSSTTARSRPWSAFGVISSCATAPSAASTASRRSSGFRSWRTRVRVSAIICGPTATG